MPCHWWRCDFFNGVSGIRQQQVKEMQMAVRDRTKPDQQHGPIITVFQSHQHQPKNYYFFNVEFRKTQGYLEWYTSKTIDFAIHNANLSIGETLHIDSSYIIMFLFLCLLMTKSHQVL